MKLSSIITLLGLFIILEASTASGHVKLTWWEWAMLTGAASLVGRAIAYMAIGKPFRFLFVKTEDHPNGIGGWTEPKYEEGWKHELGELLSCPICSGTWFAAGVLVLWNVRPDMAYMTVQLFSIGCVASVITRSVEMFEQVAASHSEQACYYREACRNEKAKK